MTVRAVTATLWAKGGNEALHGAGVTQETVLGYAGEMRVGLLGTVGRVWDSRGVKVRQPVRAVYEWMYLLCMANGRRWIDSMKSRHIVEAING